MKEYLGDSVYVKAELYQFVLTTENGFGPSNTIYLNDSVLQNLVSFVKRVKEVEEKS